MCRERQKGTKRKICSAVSSTQYANEVGLRGQVVLSEGWREESDSNRRCEHEKDGWVIEKIYMQPTRCREMRRGQSSGNSPNGPRPKPRSPDDDDLDRSTPGLSGIKTGTDSQGNGGGPRGALSDTIRDDGSVGRRVAVRMPVRARRRQGC